MSNNNSVVPLSALETTTLTKAQVYFLMKNFVYPPCKMQPVSIRRYHTLVNDLGFAGNSRRALAGKTNGVFSLPASDRFDGNDLMAIDDVGKHIDETIKKLQALGRMV